MTADLTWDAAPADWTWDTIGDGATGGTGGTTDPNTGAANPVLARMAELINSIRAAGVAASGDPRDLVIPGVLVRPPRVQFRFGGCNAADFTLWVMVADTGLAHSLPAALDLIARTQAAIGGRATDAVPDDFQTADGAVVPGYRLTWSEHL
jgi:hypothetical protein